jgi:hypothetical protein
MYIYHDLSVGTCNELEEETKLDAALRPASPPDSLVTNSLLAVLVSLQRVLPAGCAEPFNSNLRRFRLSP